MNELAPLIDISGWHSDEPVARAAIAQAFGDACRTTGFLQVIGHGVATTLTDSVLAAMSEFFMLPDAVKSEAVPVGSDAYRGWAGRKTESFSYSIGTARPADLVESFVLGSEDIAVRCSDPEEIAAHPPNVWPVDPAMFRDAMWQYFDAARSLSETLADIAASALGVDGSFFRPLLERAVVTMRANWYRRAEGEAELTAEQMALGAHTDYGILTVLLADSVPGLQVLGPDGAWHDIVPEPGAFVINIGDALAVFTNDAWRSTIHRVVPVMAPGGVARRSIALFQDGNFDAPLACLPGYVSPDRPPLYSPTTLGRHVQAKIVSGRTGVLPDTEIQTTGTRLGSG